MPPTAATTVRGEDWYGDDLTGRIAEQVTYLDVDMTETHSASGAVFTECTFRSVRFNVATHAAAAFVNCTFAGCAFFGATFTDCKLVGSRFQRCTFDRLTVRGGDWSFAGLTGADLRTASFEDVRMREADLSGARFDGGVVRRVDLAGAALQKAGFDGCDLRGSDLSAFDPWSVSLRAAVVDWQQAVSLAGAMGLDVRPD